MKIFIISVIAFAVSIGNLYAFEKNDSNEVNGDILKKKPFALQFAIGNNLTLRNFNNLQFSFKKHFSPSFNIRFGVGAYTTKEDLEGTEREFERYNTSENSFTNDFTAVLDLIYYVNPNDLMKVYGGIGPYFVYDESSYNSERESSNVFSSTSYYRYRRYVSIGANALVGVEWFPANRISIFSEYNFTFLYSWIRNIRYYYNPGGYNENTQNEGNETTFRGNELKFGLSVYF